MESQIKPLNNYCSNFKGGSVLFHVSLEEDHLHEMEIQLEGLPRETKFGGVIIMPVQKCTQCKKPKTGLQFSADWRSMTGIYARNPESRIPKSTEIEMESS